jgi:hypothetical protein
MPKKVTCARFIVAAIRQERPNRKELVEVYKVWTSVKLRQIYELAKRFYSDKQFRAGMHELLKKDDVLLVADVRAYKAREDQSKPSWMNNDNLGLRKLTRLPPRAPLDRTQWDLDLQGRSVTDLETMLRPYLNYSEPRLYIVADGIPQSTQSQLDKGDKAQAIMDSLKKK